MRRSIFGISWIKWFAIHMGVLCVCIELTIHVWARFADAKLTTYILYFDALTSNPSTQTIKFLRNAGKYNVKRQFVNNLPGLVLLNSCSTFSPDLLDLSNLYGIDRISLNHRIILQNSSGIVLVSFSLECFFKPVFILSAIFIDRFPNESNQFLDIRRKLRAQTLLLAFIWTSSWQIHRFHFLI